MCLCSADLHLVCGVFIIIQCMFIYLPFSYPKYAGSLFAANGFARSAFAAGAVLFAGPMFARLGIDGGVSLLAGLTVLCIFGIFAMYYGGAALRRRSRFAGS
jgi:DHA1 family multidrug resistance protein-like MFS transporter